MLLLLLACASPADVPAPAPPSPPVEPGPWRLVGRASPGAVHVPALPEGLAALGPACEAANRALDGDGPPCLLERWGRGPAGAEGADAAVPAEVVTFLRAGARARLTPPDGRPVRARTAWPTLGPTLEVCLGDPFAIPPAGDPGGDRTYTDEGWSIRLTGDNPCGLGGALVLHATGDRTRWDTLTVAGVPWATGGRELARPLAQARVRAVVARDLPTYDRGARVAAIIALEGDDSPEAEALRVALRR